MNKWHHLLSLSLSLASYGFSSHLPEHITEFLQWELHANVRNDPMKRPHKLLALKNFEIPTRLLTTFDYASLSKEAKESFLFRRGHEEFIRWVVNPEDTEYFRKLTSALKKMGIPSRLHEHYQGYLTASRSLMVLDPETGGFFSVKVSTNHTGGAWQNKGVNRTQVEKAVGVTNYMEELLKKTGQLPHVITLPEPIGWVFQHKGVEQGMIIRNYDRLEENYHYLPGFSAIHEDTGKESALSHHPHRYWRKHYAGALGRAVAEFVAVTGLSYKSAHSQQFLIELDEERKPTGRIVMRDFNDSMALKPLLKNSLSGRRLLGMWLRKYQENKLYIRFGVFHSSKFKMRTGEDAPSPTWVRTSDVKEPRLSSVFAWKAPQSIDKLQLKNGRLEWKNQFFKQFEDRFTELTGILKSDFKQSMKTMGGVSTHAVHRYQITPFMSSNPSLMWKNHAATMRCLQMMSDREDDPQDCASRIANFLKRLKS